jgi:hypothetical protein
MASVIAIAVSSAIKTSMTAVAATHMSKSSVHSAASMTAASLSHNWSSSQQQHDD